MYQPICELTDFEDALLSDPVTFHDRLVGAFVLLGMKQLKSTRNVCEKSNAFLKNFNMRQIPIENNVVY